MQVNANILNVQIVPKTNGRGGNYKVAEVDYKDLDQNKAMSRKVMSFGPSEKAFLALAQGISGNVVITMDKIGDYWNVVAIEKPANNVPTQSIQQDVTQSTGAFTPSTKVSDEARQMLIVRQSSLQRAIDLLTLQGNKKATIDEVVGYAEKFVDFVFDKYTPDVPLSDDIEF